MASGEIRLAFVLHFWLYFGEVIGQQLDILAPLT